MKVGSKSLTGKRKKSSRKLSKFKGIARWEGRESASSRHLVVTERAETSRKNSKNGNESAHKPDSGCGRRICRCFFGISPKTTQYHYFDHVRSAKDSVTTWTQASAVLGPEMQGYRLTDVENVRKAMEQIHSCKSGKIHVKKL